MNSQKNLEIIYGNSRKYVSDPIISYEHLINKVCQIFNLKNNDIVIEFFYFKEGELIIFNNTETMQNLMIYDNTHNSNNNFEVNVNIIEKPESNRISTVLKEKNYLGNIKEKELFELILFPEENDLKEKEVSLNQYEKSIYQEIKNVIIELNDSDIESELYLQEFENIGNLKKLIEERVQSRILTIKNLYYQRPQKLDREDHIILKSEKKSSKIVFDEKCFKCLTYPIIEYKYICLFCENLILCKSCETTHEHPCLKMSDNKIPKESTLKKIVVSSDNKKGILSNAKDFLFGSDMPQIKLYTENKSKIIYHPPDSHLNLEIFIENIGMLPIPKYGKLIPINNKDLLLNNFVVNTEIHMKQVIKIQFTCKIPNRICEYYIKFVFIHDRVDVDCQSLEINLKVCIDQESYINDFFKNDPFIKDINFTSEQKEKIFTVINNELSEKNSFQIAQILSKHKWNINSSIDELSSNTNN
jgi:hypothetical protein